MILLLGVYTNTLIAQTDETPTPNLSPKSATGSGFMVQYDGLFEPLVTESSNSTIYGFNLQRNSIGSGIYVPDHGMSLARFTQTIQPMSSVGTVEQLLAATISDATGSLKNLLSNPEFALPEPTDCTRTIAGVEQAGKRYALDLNNSPDLEQPGFVECYAFEDAAGKGVGVTLKYRDGIDNATFIDDSVLLDDILNDLTIHPLEPDTPYTYSLAQYPLHFPVLSKVEYAKQITDHAVEAKVHMQGTVLTLQIINIPEQYSTYATQTEHEEAYDKMLTEQESQSVLTRGWSAETHIAIGSDMSDLVKGHVYAYKAGEQDFYNAVYTQLDGQLLISANFTATEDASERVHQYAKLLFNHSRGASIENRTRHAFPGFDLNLPSGYFCTTPQDATRFDEYLVSTQSLLSYNEKLNRVYSRVPMTRFKIYGPGELTSLDDTHFELLNDLMNRVKAPDQPIEHYTSDKYESEDSLTVSNFTLPNGNLVQRISTTIFPQLNTELYRSLSYQDTSLTVTSYLVPNVNTGVMCVASTISNTKLAPSADDITIVLLDSLTASTSMTEKDLGFAKLNYDPFANKLYKVDDDYDGSYNCFLSNTHEQISIFVSQSNQRNEVKSARLLAETHMKHAWGFHTTGENTSLFPSDMTELKDTTLAGRDALLFEKHVTPENSWLSSEAPKPQLIRLYGFSYNDRFVTIAMKQNTEHVDPSRLDEWAKAFTQQ